METLDKPMYGDVVDRNMANTEQQEKTMSELVVTELIEQGLNSSMRDSILEGVEASEGTSSDGSRSLPLAGALFGLGAAVGFLAGQSSSELEDVSLEDVEEPEIIEDMTEEVGEAMAETDSGTEKSDSSSSRLMRLLLVVGALAGVAILRRRFASEEMDEWEPIEEFEPATDISGEDEGEHEEVEEGEGADMNEEDTEEAEADTGEETEE